MKAQKPARRHHTVPRFYLEGFGCPHRKGRLLVLDAAIRKQFNTAPEHLTVERDFNRIDAPGVAPDVLEAALGELESDFCTALRRTVDARKLQSDEDKILIANFAALLMVRNPRFRSQMARMSEDILKLTMQAQVSNKAHWEQQVEKMKAAGYMDGVPEVTFEELRDFVRSDEYDVRFPREYYIKHEMKLLETIPQLVARRNWILLEAAADSGGFVTCDHPATLVWSDPETARSPYGPGLGVAGTLLMLPLSSEMAMVGSFEAPDATLKIGRPKVAMFNGATITSARRQVYCRGPEAAYVLRDDSEPRGCMRLLTDDRFKMEKLPKLPWY